MISLYSNQMLPTFSAQRLSSNSNLQSETKKLLGLYNKDEMMSSDQAYPTSEDYDDDSEDFYVNTDKAISFAMKRK